MTSFVVNTWPWQGMKTGNISYITCAQAQTATAYSMSGVTGITRQRETLFIWFVLSVLKLKEIHYQ